MHKKGVLIMANNNIMFKKGTWSQFKQNILGIQEDGTQGASKIEKGALYLTEDEGGLYLGTSDGGIKRIQGSLVIYDEALTF
jgi:hypothetical protein